MELVFWSAVQLAPQKSPVVCACRAVDVGHWLKNDIIHNIPEGLAVSVPIYYATKSKFKRNKEFLKLNLQFFYV